MQTHNWSGAATAQQANKTSERRYLVLDRAPARNIADPNPVFRAIVLDAEHGEVFMANDKESAGTSILVYPTQFQPTNRIMEPRRRVAGPKTDLGMVCGLALSVEHDELYSVSGETGTLNVYPLDAQGNVGPGRRLIGVMPRASAGVFLDVKHDELFITTEHVNRISVYPRTFKQDKEPLRMIQGPHTLLNLPDGLNRDPVSGEIIVANSGDDSVLFFDKDASGDAAPVRVLKGPATKFKGPAGVSIDAKRNELWVASWDSHIAGVFPRTANGNVAPLRVIRTAPESAPLASMGRIGAVAYDPKRKEILAPN